VKIDKIVYFPGQGFQNVDDSCPKILVSLFLSTMVGHVTQRMRSANENMMKFSNS